MCLSPVNILNPHYQTPAHLGDPRLHLLDVSQPDYRITVPCGKCLECRKSNVLQWRSRLTLERSVSPVSTFATFTIAPIHYEKFILPGTNIVDRDSAAYLFRLFFDRCRKCGISFRHFVINENGSERDRLHFHAILFSDTPIDFKLLERCWSYGFIFLGYCDGRTINYTTKYILKSYISQDYKPLLLASNRPHGIGHPFLTEDNLRVWSARDPFYLPNVNLGGYKFPYPKYLRPFTWSKEQLKEGFKKYCMLQSVNYHNDCLKASSKPLSSSFVNAVESGNIILPDFYDPFISQSNFQDASKEFFDFDITLKNY